MTPARNSSMPAPPARKIRRWRSLQVVALAAALFMLVALALIPRWGLNAVWNLWVPMLPALLVVVPGAWRNVCPLAAAALFPESRRKHIRPRLSATWQDRLQVAGAAGFLLIVPLRHVVFDRSADATLLLLSGLAATALAVGFATRGKSGWCSGLCPLRAAERLYGIRSAAPVSQLHCLPCSGCISPCPDLAAPAKLRTSTRRPVRVRTNSSFAAVFPGFVWGWFHVPDTIGPIRFTDVLHGYAVPFGWGLVSAALFVVLRSVSHGRHDLLRERLFVTASVILYYWHRLPALLGFGTIPGDGVLVDLTDSLPQLTPTLLRLASTALLAWWMLLRHAPPVPWTTLLRVAPKPRQSRAA